MAALSRTNRRVPKLCLHKATGQAVVRLNGKDHYLGRFDSAESQGAYDRLIAEWLQRGRHTPDASPAHPHSRPTSPSVNDLLLTYWHHAAGYYHDAPVERDKIRHALRPLRELYGPTPAAEFGPLALRNVRQHLLVCPAAEVGHESN